MVAMLGKELVERYVDVKKAEMDMQGGMTKEERKTWLIERY